MMPLSPGIDHGRPVPRALGWSVAVILVGGALAVFTTPTASHRTVLQQGVGPAVPAEGPGPVTGGGTVSLAGAATPATAATASRGGAPAPTASAAARTRARVAANTTAATAAAAVTGPAAKAAPPAKVQPDAGSYPLRISGSSSVDGKAASVPGSGSLVVQSLGGDQQQSTPGMPGGLVLVQRASPAGTDLVSFSMTAGSKTLTFRPASPLAFVRTDPGASWSWSARSTDGTVGLSQTASVTGGGSVSVGGTSVPTVTVQRTFSVSGAVQGTVRLTSSVSLLDRLPLVQHEVIDVKATALGLLTTHVASDTTATITSNTPR